MPHVLTSRVRPLSRWAHRLVRRARGQSALIIRFNHPVTPEAWDRRKGVRGWVASEVPVQSVVIHGPGAEDAEVRLAPRPDVEHHVGGQFACTVGFLSRRSLGDWLGTRDEVSLTVRVTLVDGRTGEANCVFRANPEQAARWATFRPVMRCPTCRGALPEVEGGLSCPACATVYPVRRGVADFLTRQVAAEFGVEDTDNISSWGYDERVDAMLAACPDGLFLDCGAGLRHRVHPRILNYEIVDYTSTDVIGVGEKLPFADASFDGVISVAVLEHVQDPFRCAAELQRVLKPGGTLFAAVPFLQPRHGYPHHYYNMTSDGLRRLFPGLDVLEQSVPLTCHPIESLRWFLLCYCRGLPEKERRQFERMSVRELMELPPNGELARNPVPVVQALAKEACFDIASATCLLARKP